MLPILPILLYTINVNQTRSEYIIYFIYPMFCY